MGDQVTTETDLQAEIDRLKRIIARMRKEAADARPTPRPVTAPGWAAWGFTPHQEAILRTLYDARGGIVSASMLTNQLATDAVHNTAAVHIARIRAKLAPADVIATRKHAGYYLTATGLKLLAPYLEKETAE